MPLIEDSYFLKASEALETAKQQNVFGAYNNLQICYYDGEKVASNLKNFIHLPLEKMAKKLLALNTRIPTKCIGIPKEKFDKEKEEFYRLQNEIFQKNLKIIQRTKLDFNEKKRVYMSVDYGSKVLLKIYTLLKTAFEKQNCDVLYDINNELTVMDDNRRVQKMAEFKPHICFNINRIRNEYLNEETFNFIWFQDPTLVLYDDTNIKTRKRDTFFYLVDNFKVALESKHVPSQQMKKQTFATNSTLFYRDEKIAKENKIIFIGNNYFEVVSPTKSYSNHNNMLNELRHLFNDGSLTNELLDTLSKKYVQEGVLKSKEHLEMFIFPALVREEILKWLCEISPVDVEIYGEGWEHEAIFQAHYKGYISDENRLCEVTNSAKYSLLAHPEYYYQQRLLEASACDSIALVYEGVNNRELFKHRDHVLCFSNKEELLNIIGKKPKKAVQKIAQDISYDNFVQKILTQVDTKIQEDK